MLIHLSNWRGDWRNLFETCILNRARCAIGTVLEPSMMISLVLLYSFDVGCVFGLCGPLHVDLCFLFPKGPSHTG